MRKKDKMKKVFKFNKGEIWDGDEEIIHYLEYCLLEDNSRGLLDLIKKNWKVTVIIKEDI